MIGIKTIFLIILMVNPGNGYILSGILAFLLLLYLIYTLIKPEKF